MQWYYSKNGTQLGPVEEGEIRAKLAAGQISPTDLVWRDGMPDWLAASKVAEFASVSTVPAADSPISAVPGGVVGSPYTPPVHVGGTISAPTSGLAIASLICGIMGLITCLLLPGIPAVICGHMALSHMAAPGVLIGGRGMAIAGLIMGYIAVVSLFGGLILLAVGAFANSVH